MTIAKSIFRYQPRPARRGAGGKPRKLTPCLRFGHLELERRQLPAAMAVPISIVPVAQVHPGETVDTAGDLGALDRTTTANGTIGEGPAAGADVNWYHFSLDRPTHVTLTLGPDGRGGAFGGVLSLYNEDPFDFGDRLSPLGHRMTAQGEAAGPAGVATVDAVLPAGGYDVAVSGAGNRLFNPYLAGSGYAGSTGRYTLVASTSPASPAGATADGPAVLSSDPAPGAVLDRSPLAVRLELSKPLAPSTVDAGRTVRLVYNPKGSFGDGHDVAVGLGSVNYSAAANELQIFPARALAPGVYQVTLSGDTSRGGPALSSPDGAPLGSSGGSSRGHDNVFTFRVTGIEGGAAAPDTPATAHDLGDVTGSGLVQAAGAIGNDPFYDAASLDPARNPGNGVEMYHFRVSGPGRFAFAAEVFAGRIGSPLDPGLALYQVDPATHALRFLAGNDNTQDSTAATNGSVPLSSDAALFQGIGEGDYYVAVSGGSNTPSPLEGRPVGSPGLYDPSRSHSGSGGFSTGPYALNLLVQPLAAAVQIVSTGPAEGASLDAAPMDVSVQFSGPVNLQQLAYQAYQVNAGSALPAVYVLGSNGTRYFPRFDTFDAVTETARFRMLDALPNGAYELHLSGPAGLTDLSGAPVAGNTAGGDYVVRFKVAGALRGRQGDPLTRAASFTTPGPQDLGPIFPHEWQAAVGVTRDFSSEPTRAPAVTEDAYRFRILQQQTYLFQVAGTGLPVPTDGTSPLRLTDESGTPVVFGVQADGGVIVADLSPGVYVVHVGAWPADRSGSVAYRLKLQLLGTADNPQPLVAGPSPALQIRLDSAPAASDMMTGDAFASTIAAVENVGPSGPAAVSGPTAVEGPFMVNVSPGGGGPVGGAENAAAPAAAPAGGSSLASNSAGVFHAGGTGASGVVEFAAPGVGPVGGAGGLSGAASHAAGAVVVSLPSSQSTVPASLAMMLVSTQSGGVESVEGVEAAAPEPTGVVGVSDQVALAEPAAAADAADAAVALSEVVAGVAARPTEFEGSLPSPSPATLASTAEGDAAAGPAGPEAAPVGEAGAPEEVSVTRWGASIAAAAAVAVAYVRARKGAWFGIKTGAGAGAPAAEPAGARLFRRRRAVGAVRARRAGVGCGGRG